MVKGNYTTGAIDTAKIFTRNQKASKRRNLNNDP